MATRLGRKAFPVCKLDRRLAGFEPDAAHGASRAQERATPGARQAQRRKQRCQDPTRPARQGQRSGRGSAQVQADEKSRQSVRRRKNEAARGAQLRVKTRLPLVPPKPNELDSAARIGILRALFGT